MEGTDRQSICPDRPCHGHFIDGRAVLRLSGKRSSRSVQCSVCPQIVQNLPEIAYFIIAGAVLTTHANKKCITLHVRNPDVDAIDKTLTRREKMKSRGNRIHVVLVSLLVMPVAWAQDEAPSNAIEEVIVTATKRAESVQTVPIAISAISGEELENRGITNLAQALINKLGDYPH